MEEKIEEFTRRLFEVSSGGVKGVVCSDEKGAPFCCRGTLDARSAAVVSQLALLASSLEPAGNVQPSFVSLSSEKSKVLLKRNNQLVVAVHK